MFCASCFMLKLPSLCAIELPVLVLTLPVQLPLDLLWCLAPVLLSPLFTLSVFVTSFPCYDNFSHCCSSSLLLYCFSFRDIFLFLDLLTWVQFSYFFAVCLFGSPAFELPFPNLLCTRSLCDWPRSPVSVTNLNRKVLNWLFTRSFASFFFFFCSSAYFWRATAF